MISSGHTYDAVPHCVFEQCFQTDPISTGKERDSESGLDYFGAKYYGSNMGRFLSPDWNNDPEPVPWADFSDPQTLNLYSYVGNNPLSHENPDGHMCDGGSTDANGVFTFHCSNERPQKAMDQGAVNPGDLGLGAYAFGKIGEIAVRGVISGVSLMIGRDLPTPAPKGG